MIDFPKNLIPQKEDLEEIAIVPRLIQNGLTSSEDIANYFNQTVRHGSFFLNACMILGWTKNREITSAGKKLINSTPDELNVLIKKAVLNSQIFKLLDENIGGGWYLDANPEKISNFLERELGVAPSTAKRRASTLYAWAKYVSGESITNRTRSRAKTDEPISSAHPHKLPGLVMHIKVKGITFEAGFVDENGDVIALILDTCKAGLSRSLQKISSVYDNRLRFLIFLPKKNNLKLSLALRGEYDSISEKIIKIEIDKKSKEKQDEIIQSYLSNNKKMLKLLNL